MARNDMFYPQYGYPFRPMQQPVSLLRCSGASEAIETKLPPDSTAAVFDDQADRVYIVTNEGDLNCKSRIKFTFDLVKVSTPNDSITRAEFDELRRAIEDVKHAVSEPSDSKSASGTTAGKANGK